MICTAGIRIQVAVLVQNRSSAPDRNHCDAGALSFIGQPLQIGRALLSWDAVQLAGKHLGALCGIVARHEATRGRRT